MKQDKQGDFKKTADDRTATVLGEKHIHVLITLLLPTCEQLVTKPAFPSLFMKAYKLIFYVKSFRYFC